MMILRIPNTGFVSVVVHNMYVGTLVLCCVVMYKIMYKDTCTKIVTANRQLKVTGIYPTLGSSSRLRLRSVNDMTVIMKQEFS